VVTASGLIVFRVWEKRRPRGPLRASRYFGALPNSEGDACACWPVGRASPASPLGDPRRSGFFRGAGLNQGGQRGFASERTTTGPARASTKACISRNRSARPCRENGVAMGQILLPEWKNWDVNSSANGPGGTYLVPIFFRGRQPDRAGIRLSGQGSACVSLVSSGFELFFLRRWAGDQGCFFHYWRLAAQFSGQRGLPPKLGVVRGHFGAIGTFGQHPCDEVFVGRTIGGGQPAQPLAGTAANSLRTHITARTRDDPAADGARSPALAGIRVLLAMARDQCAAIRIAQRGEIGFCSRAGTSVARKGYCGSV